MRIVFSSLLLLVFLCGAAQAAEEERTANRSVFGAIIYPDWLFDKPDHYEFSAAVSHYDPLTQHPHAYDGADWETKDWNKKWTPAGTVGKLFSARIFEGQYMRGGTPSLAVGAPFYHLSDLDQRRSLKLLADYSGVFRQGFRFFSIVDAETGEAVGTYSPKGMFLN